MCKTDVAGPYVTGGGSLPNYLQKVNITKITNNRCSQLWQSVTGASIFDSHICFFDEVGQDKSACNVSVFLRSQSRAQKAIINKND